jgi:hypothetical protein
LVLTPIETPPAAFDAYAIWLRARSAVTSANYPSSLDYTIAVSGLDGTEPTVNHYRASCDPFSGAVWLFPISDEELAQPPVPHGITVRVGPATTQGRWQSSKLTAQIGHPPPYQDLLGEPLLSPTYMFGIRYAHAPANITPPAAPSTLPIIATVSAAAPEYRVTLIDAPMLDEVPTYHLRLTPLERPKANRLRELWIGKNDYLPRKAAISANFTMAPLDEVPWTIDFLVVDGSPFVTRESADATLYLPHNRVVHNAVIAFQAIHEPYASIYDRPLITPDAADLTLTEP